MNKLFFIASLLFINNSNAVVDEIILADSFPEKLSEYEFFLDTKAQIPNDKVIPYELISSLFSDYSLKQRWVYVPSGLKAQYVRDEVFNFPVGSALIKTFYYPVDERDLSLGKKLLETRVLLRKSNGWRAVSYAWNSDQSDAFKKVAGKTIPVDWIDSE